VRNTQPDAKLLKAKSKLDQAISDRRAAEAGPADIDEKLVTMHYKRMAELIAAPAATTTEGLHARLAALTEYVGLHLEWRIEPDFALAAEFSFAIAADFQSVCRAD
jgi:hypothetical protein